jgi:hypothetical protein
MIARLTYRGKTPANMDIITRNVDEPGLHNRVIRPQVTALGTQEIVCIPAPKGDVAFFDPVGSQIIAHRKP